MIIHQIWYNFDHSKKEVPIKYRENQRSWVTKHPNYYYLLWNEEMGDKLIKESYPNQYELYKNVKYPIMKIDLLRYCILEKFGGMYVDMDYYCVNGLDEYIQANDFDIFINEGGSMICNSLLISKRPNAFWNQVLLEAFERIRTYTDFNHIYYVVKTTGPLLIRDLVTEENKNLFRIKILPADQFNFCNSCQNCYPSKTEKLYAVHSYDSTWNKDYWLKIRSFFTCTDRKQLAIMMIVIICVIWIIYLLIKNRF